MAQAQPHVLDQIALLDSVAGPRATTALQRVDSLYQETPKQQVDFELQGLNNSIERQQSKFNDLNVVTLNFRDPLEAKISGEFFASLFPDPLRAKLGIMELMMNAIEHGNLDIDSEEKNKLLASGDWMKEITNRLINPGNKEKRVHAYCYRDPKYVQITIRDDGHGFDWQPYLDNKHAQPDSKLNGRGITVAKNIAFDELMYSDKGNVVWGLQYINQ